MASKPPPGSRPCPACDGNKARYLGRKDDYDLLRCRGCGTLFTSLLPGASGAKDYDDYYVPENLTIPDFINARLDEIVDSFAPYRKSNRLLDLGCGTGVLMQAASRAGWDAEGVEISAKAVEYVRSQGGKVFCGRLDEASFPDNHFDVVASSEVLEHVDDPQGFVRDVARILRPGGLFWATTPHGRGVSARALGLRWSIVVPPDHLLLVSLAGIRALLAAAGFRRSRVVAHAVNPYELMSGILKPRKGAESCTDLHNKERIQTSYQLNEFLTSSPSRKLLRTVANGLLGVARLGDDIKIRAEK